MVNNTDTDTPTSTPTSVWDCVHPCAMLCYAVSTGALALDTVVLATLDAYGYCDKTGQQPDYDKMSREIKRYTDLQKVKNG